MVPIQSKTDIGNEEPESVQSEGGARRRSFIKKVATSLVVAPLVVGRALDAQANVNAPDTSFLPPGTLVKVLAASGVRAGVLTRGTGKEPVSAVRKPFATKDAYVDPGFWFFFYEKHDVIAAARVFTSRTSGKKVAFASVGQRSITGPQLISSMGTLVFEDLGGRLVCRQLAASHRDLRTDVPISGQHCSTYFVSMQDLEPVDKASIDQGSKARINDIIRKTAIRLGFAPRSVWYL